MVLGRGETLAQDAQASRPADAPPSAMEMLAAYDLVEPWVRSMHVPDDATGPEVVGACVTLRFDGRVVGIGTVFGAGKASLPESARLAIAQARERLPIVDDAMYAERLRLAASQITLSLEVAGRGVPVEAESYAQVSMGFDPGIDGVALRIGDYAGAVFPAEMLWTSQEAGGALSRLVSGMTGDATLAMKPLKELREGADVGVLRFRVQHLAQLKPGGHPEFLHRGGRIVPDDAVRTTEGLRTWMEGLASYLIAQRDVGVYLPVNDVVRSGPTPLQRGLRMYALQRFAALNPDSELAEGAREASGADANRILTAWDDGVPVGVPAIALLAGALDQGLVVDDESAVRERVRKALFEASYSIESVPDPERPMVLWGLASLGEFERAKAIVSVCRQTDSPGDLVGRMPWLGWAELRLVGDSELPSAVALREMRQTMWRFQLTPGDVGPEGGDLVGGIVFTRSRLPLPTWQASRPLAFTATMLGDPRLTGSRELPEQMTRLLGSLRFQRQLSADESNGWMYRSPERWRWGIRSAVWDQQMPIEASAMALLTVGETLSSLDRLTANQSVKAEAAGGE
ncbi:MAG TPA: hypothetical protein ENJ00_06715 [Phycisphaerales bacterium]|nr:hypothetical protein [Phycisphaerales bacterium]